MHAERRARLALLVVALAALLAASACGRKGALEIPDAPPRPNPLTTALDAPEAAGDDTVVRDTDEAPPLPGTIGPEAELRAADVRGANADAPEPGDAVPEGPRQGDGSAARAGPRRFVLDPLL